MTENENNGFIVTVKIIRFLLNLLSRAGLAGVVTYSIWLPIEHYHYWFSWHVILCTLGYVPIMTESLLLFNGDDGWSELVTKRTKYIIHGVLITSGTVCFTAGNITLMYFTKSKHFSTVHGITGLISMILCLLSLLLGLATYNSTKLRKCVRPVLLKFIHNLVGIIGYIIGIISLCYAFYTRWWIFYTEENSRLAAVIVTVITTLWTLNGSICSGYNQINSLLR
ncbi:transmembrane reductase CYB561D2-like [Coccinella septempunctata]|uniref:transmembrane reductase CYB561D2-like n=1 Tax=Coccinella septempunctata TaxID=41139 RepID=UPI001D076529|nr:transmembrane reductase CYB561D2-like [Coccinella septempunctata]